MANLPYYVVPLTHTEWEDARAYAKRLPREAIPELRLDHYKNADAEELVDSLRQRCVVSCRRVSDGGLWPDEDEARRLDKIKAALRGKPHWIDIEWDLDIPGWLGAELTHTRLLRSHHAPKGVFDLETRLQNLPRGDIFKWVGHASNLSDNARIKKNLSWARNRRLSLSAFLMGNKGIVSRCMQAAWGGAFTYAAPDNAEAAAPGQIKLRTMMLWRCHKLHIDYELCGVVGTPVLQSAGPSFHNNCFHRSFKDLLYLPLEADSAEEVLEAAENLSLLGLSVTMPLKEQIAALLGVQDPINTMWRRVAGNSWQCTNTDALALEGFLDELPRGPILILGSGGVAKISMNVIEKRGWPAISHSRCMPQTASDVRTFAPVGVIQATSLGMNESDPLPYSDALEAAFPTLRWAADWVNAKDTAFTAWAKAAGLRVVTGSELFEKQATLQSEIFIRECGGA